MKKIIRYTLAAIMALSVVSPAVSMADEKDYDESVRMPVRRLHPERERDKALKKMQEEEKKKQKKQGKGKETPAPAVDDPWGDGTVVNNGQDASPDKALMRELLSKDYSLVKYEIDFEEEVAKPIAWKDDPVSTDIDGLRRQVTITGNGGRQTVMPKGMSTARDNNAVAFCFDTDGNTADALKLRVQYYADDPLNYNDIEFTIDGFDYKFKPAAPARGKLGARMYWEQSEDVLTVTDKDLVYALAHCHWARIKLKGADGMNHVKMLTQEQLDAFNATLELYRAMGGTFQ